MCPAGVLYHEQESKTMKPRDGATINMRYNTCYDRTHAISEGYYTGLAIVSFSHSIFATKQSLKGTSSALVCGQVYVLHQRKSRAF